MTSQAPPPEEASFRVSDGCQIAFRVEGPPAAEVLVLSNSLGTAMAMWEPQMAALRERFRVVRYDSRGHGRSDAPPGPYRIAQLGGDVVELLDALSVKTASFCGLSMGGMVGQWLGFSRPERLNRLVLANTTAYMGPPASWDARISAVTREGTSAIADAVIDRWFTPSFRASSPEVAARIAAMLRSSDDLGYAASCAAIRDMDFRSDTAGILAETLVIAGDSDPATPLEQGRALAASIPGARLDVLPAAHLSNVEQPDLFTDALLGFVLAKR